MPDHCMKQTWNPPREDDTNSSSSFTSMSVWDCGKDGSLEAWVPQKPQKGDKKAQKCLMKSEILHIENKTNTQSVREIKYICIRSQFSNDLVRSYGTSVKLFGGVFGSSFRSYSSHSKITHLKIHTLRRTLAESLYLSLLSQNNRALNLSMQVINMMYKCRMWPFGTRWKGNEVNSKDVGGVTMENFKRPLTYRPIDCVIKCKLN